MRLCWCTTNLAQHWQKCQKQIFHSDQEPHLSRTIQWAVPSDAPQHYSGTCLPLGGIHKFANPICACTGLGLIGGSPTTFLRSRTQRKGTTAHSGYRTSKASWSSAKYPASFGCTYRAHTVHTKKRRWSAFKSSSLKRGHHCSLRTGPQGQSFAFNLL